MLLSRKSSHHQLSNIPKENHQIISKTMSVHAQQANYTKLVEEDMLNKLLRPPAKKQNKGQLRKYDPQFQKPDVQKLIHENNILKQELTESKKTIMELKCKTKQLQKKVQKLEATQSQELQENEEGKKKNFSVHTEILKKKIHELHIKYINAENEIKKLKGLPSSSIYEENNIEKQHLLAQTIRLKAVLSTYQKQNNESDSFENNYNGHGSVNSNKFHQQFLKILKQENEKLKATIRLLENDKVLMKARQTNQNKLNNDLKKQLEAIKAKFIAKQAELEKLAHQNENLLFKKAAKFRFDKEQKENKLITQLTKNIEELRLEKKKIADENQILLADNLHLKQKEKNKNSQLLEKDQQLDKIKIQIAEIKNEYEARIKSLQMNKFHPKDSGYGMKSSKGRNNDGPNYEFQQMQSVHRRNQFIQQTLIEKKQQFNWGKPVKFEELDLCLLKIWTLIEQGEIEKYEDILLPRNRMITSRNNKQPTTIKFEEAYYLLKSGILNLSAEHSLKLAKYIFSDHSRIVHARKVEQPVIEHSLATTIIRAAVTQFTQCLTNPTVINSWRCLLSKSKKLIKQLEQVPQQILSRDDFIQILLKNKNSSLERDEINYMILYGFSLADSNNQVMISRKLVLECMYQLVGDSKRMVHKSDYTQFPSQHIQRSIHSPQDTHFESSEKLRNSIEISKPLYPKSCHHPDNNQSMKQLNKFRSQKLYELMDLGLEQLQEGEGSLGSQRQLNIQKVQTESNKSEQSSQIDQSNELNLHSQGQKDDTDQEEEQSRIQITDQQNLSKDEEIFPQNSIIFKKEFSSLLLDKKNLSASSNQIQESQSQDESDRSSQN